MLGPVSIVEYSQNKEPERVKEEIYRLLKELRPYKMEKKKLEKNLLGKKVVMKAMTRNYVDQESIVILLKTWKSLLKKKNEELYSSSSQTTTSCGRIMDKILKNIPPVYLRFAFNIVGAILRYLITKFSELLTFVSELRNNRK